MPSFYRAAQAGHRRQLVRRQPVHARDEDAEAAERASGMRRFSVRKPSPAPCCVAPSSRPSLLPWATRPLTEYGRPSSDAAVADRPRPGLAHRGTRYAHAVHLVAHHAGHVEAERAQPGIRVVACARTETEVVAHQHAAHARPLEQHAGDEVVGQQRCRGARRSAAGSRGRCRSARARRACRAAFAMRAGEIRLAGAAREEIARVRLEREHAARHAAMAGLAAQQGQHRLVAAVDAVEVADGQRGAAFRQGEGGKGAEAATRLWGIIKPSCCGVGSTRGASCDAAVRY